MSETTLGYQLLGIEGENSDYIARVSVEPKAKIKIKRSLQVPISFSVQEKNLDKMTLKVQFDGEEKNFKKIPQGQVRLEKGSYFSITSKSL